MVGKPKIHFFQSGPTYHGKDGKKMDGKNIEKNKREQQRNENESGGSHKHAPLSNGNLSGSDRVQRSALSPSCSTIRTPLPNGKTKKARKRKNQRKKAIAMCLQPTDKAFGRRSTRLAFGGAGE
jgi:hypothetical protein